MLLILHLQMVEYCKSRELRWQISKGVISLPVMPLYNATETDVMHTKNEGRGHTSWSGKQMLSVVSSGILTVC